MAVRAVVCLAVMGTMCTVEEGVRCGRVVGVGVGVGLDLVEDVRRGVRREGLRRWMWMCVRGDGCGKVGWQW